MINKRSLWFLTLFSLILVLSVYYITMPSELLLTQNSSYTSKEVNECTTADCDTPKTDIVESEILTALRVEWDEQVSKQIDELKEILTNSETTVDEKNAAFEKMKQLNITRGEEEKLEKSILEQYKFKSFVKIDGDQIRVVVNSEELSEEQANNIMRLIQSNYDKKMYISVKFQK